MAEEVGGGGRLGGVGPPEFPSPGAGAAVAEGEGSTLRLAQELVGEAGQAGIELAGEGIAGAREGGHDDGLWLGVVTAPEPFVRALADARGRTVGLVVVGAEPASARLAPLAAACSAASGECWAFLLPTAVPLSAAERACADSGERPVAPEGGRVVVWR